MLDDHEDGEIRFLPGFLDAQDERDLLREANAPHNDDTHSECAGGTVIHCNVCFARAALDMHYGIDPTTTKEKR